MGRAPTWSERDGAREPSFRASSAQLGVLVLLASLGVLFLGGLAAFIITRLQNAVWIAPGMPPLPRALWLSSALLVLVSAALEVTLARTRQNRPVAARHAMNVVWLGGLGFLGCQVWCWFSMQAGLVAHTTLYPFSYFFLTGLHAVHVLAGFVPLGIVTRELRAREYSSSRHQGLRLCIQYWHFLGGVWLVLFVALKLLS